MNYLIPMCNCYILDNKPKQLLANVKYEIMENSLSVIVGENILPFVFDVNNLSNNILKVNCGKDNYFFLSKNFNAEYFSTVIKFNSKEVSIILTQTLRVCVNAELICEENVENLTYSHYEIFKKFCLIYFVGNRNAVVIIDDENKASFMFYDECNNLENEKYFMCRLKDSLNHGRVFHLVEDKFENYLVYLDDNEMKLKNEFTAFVFLDCVKAKNYKYCNHLLCENLKMDNENNIAKFFSDFDYFYPISCEEFILLKKNTLSGIYKFEISNCEIVNIICR